MAVGGHGRSREFLPISTEDLASRSDGRSEMTILSTL
jgi:hypothetical protein